MPHVLTDLKPGDHILHIYSTETEYYTILVSFIQQGLEKGEKVVYATAAASAQDILAALKAVGCDPTPYLTRGQLMLLPADSVYFSEEGHFVPERLWQLIQSTLESSAAEGYPAVRLGGEMSWILQNRPGTDRLLEYESYLNRGFTRKNYLLLCQYHRQRFPADVLLDMLCCHPVAIIGDHVSTNFYYRPGTHLRHIHMGAGRLRTWLESLRQDAPIPEPNMGYSPLLASHLRQRQQARKAAQHVFGELRAEESNPQLYL